jgi:hypothetical protein
MAWLEWPCSVRSIQESSPSVHLVPLGHSWRWSARMASQSSANGKICIETVEVHETRPFQGVSLLSASGRRDHSQAEIAKHT